MLELFLYLKYIFLALLFLSGPVLTAFLLIVWKNKSWLESLINMVIGNLKLSVSNIHIRYEDTERWALFNPYFNHQLHGTLLISFCSNPGHPFAAGVTLDKLLAVTVDDTGQETFATGGALERIQKVLVLWNYKLCRYRRYILSYVFSRALVFSYLLLHIFLCLCLFMVNILIHMTTETLRSGIVESSCEFVKAIFDMLSWKATIFYFFLEIFLFWLLYFYLSATVYMCFH